MDSEPDDRLTIERIERALQVLKVSLPDDSHIYDILRKAAYTEWSLEQGKNIKKLRQRMDQRYSLGLSLLSQVDAARERYPLPSGELEVILRCTRDFVQNVILRIDNNGYFAYEPVYDSPEGCVACVQMSASDTADHVFDLLQEFRPLLSGGNYSMKVEHDYRHRGRELHDSLTIESLDGILRCRRGSISIPIPEICSINPRMLREDGYLLQVSIGETELRLNRLPDQRFDAMEDVIIISTLQDQGSCKISYSTSLS